MELPVRQDDDPEFLGLMEQLILGYAEQSSPRNVVVIKLNNWFDHKWLGFSGKGRVAFGMWGGHLVDLDTALDEFHQDQITLPPFSPRRITEEYCFQREESGGYSTCDPRLHIHQRKLASSAHNLHKRLVDRFDSAILVWFSSNTKQNRRGSILVYEIQEAQVYPWYAALAKKASWHVVRTKGITRAQFESMIGRDVKQPA